MSCSLRTESSAAAGAALPGEHEATAEPRATCRPRLDSVDFLRGLVMAVMVLDHARRYLGFEAGDVRDVHDPSLFLTRWITHYCAPIFVMLAGVSAYLYGSRGRTTAELARFLFTRGAWLVAIELTLVRFAWQFNFIYDFTWLQVIWAIGWALIVLAALVHLPHRAIAAFGLAMILGHNLLDGIEPQRFGEWQWLWMILHAPGTLRPAPGVEVLALYPLIPWVGVLAAGYGLGPLLLLDSPRRRRALLTIGIVATAGFVVLRAVNVYGDPQPWSVQSNPLATLLSFLNCEKYPPSLAYLAMTLGPGLVVLALFREARGKLGRALVMFGRVPFLFYVAHIFLLHALAVLIAQCFFGESGWLFIGAPASGKPEEYGVSLPVVYGLTMLALVLLYPLCSWFAALKQRRRDWWLSYL